MRTRSRRARRIGTVAAAALLASAGALTPAASGAAAGEVEPPIAHTADGDVRGRSTEDHRIFQGIPFAKPPTGSLRFRSPRPVEPWSGVKDATKRKVGCSQWFPGGNGPTFYGREDCLYLNVHVPTGEQVQDAGELPVMVFFHGGGFGGGDGGAYDPRRVTRQGGVIVVTANYRLGPLGFLGHPSLGDPAVGNFGLADQQAALRWVQRNISAFGGDPGNVTLWGESAGAYSVCAQLASPAARGLFHRAIMQSGPCGNDLLTRKEAAQRAEQAADALGCRDANVAACLRQVPAKRISKLQYERVRLTRHITDLPWMPVASTPVLPLQPMAAAERGVGSQVPLLLGSTREEMRQFVIDRYREGKGLVSAKEYPRLVRALFGADAESVLAEYPHERYDSPSTATATILTDEGRAAGACQLLRYADEAVEHEAVYLYEFAEPKAPDENSIPGFPYGALHGVDVPYFFDSYWASSTSPDQDDARERLARTLIRQWTAFAATGSPGSGWSRYADGQARSFSAAGVSRVDMAAQHNCSFWVD